MYTLYYYYVLLGTYYSNNRGIREEAKITINAARLMVLTIIETVFLPLFNHTTPTSTTLATYTGTTTDTSTNAHTSTNHGSTNNTNNANSNSTTITTYTTANNTNNNNKLLSSLRYLALRLFNMNTLPEYRRDAMIGSELYGT